MQLQLIFDEYHIKTKFLPDKIKADIPGEFNRSLNTAHIFFVLGLQNWEKPVPKNVVQLVV
jgi:hypothetical protein